jgi:hypothetical protein
LVGLTREICQQSESGNGKWVLRDRHSNISKGRILTLDILDLWYGY